MVRRERMLAGALVVLGLNSLYLAARADASLLYFANVGLHVVLGLAAAAALGRLARRHWASLDAPWRSAAVAFSLGSLLGVALVFTGATRPWRPLLYAHVGLVGLAAFLALAAGLRHTLGVPKGVVRAAATAAALLALAAPQTSIPLDTSSRTRSCLQPPWTGRARGRAGRSSRPRPRPTWAGPSRRTSS
jgi:hypothetical protein